MRRQNRISLKFFDRLDNVRGKTHCVSPFVTLGHRDEDIIALDRIC